MYSNRSFLHGCARWSILGNVTPVYEYEPHTWGPAEADRLAADIGGWHNPQEAS
jgi:hypothetical protein